MSTRIFQVIKYGWLHSSQMAQNHNEGFIKRLCIFVDIVICFKKYKMWSNQYLKEDFYYKKANERKLIGDKYLQAGIIRDNWQDDFQRNRKFLAKYSDIRYEVGNLREKRRRAYQKFFNTGNNLCVEYNVNISRQHYLEGSINIGNNVLLAKNVFIDYSGKVIIKDNVQITNEVIIETHSHAFHSDYKKSHSIITPSELIIEEGVVIGSRSIIMPTCHYIGKHSRIGAGSVVTHDVPDYAVVVGVPAKVIRYME